MERPSPQEAQELLQSPHLRAARFAGHLAELPNPKPPLRGRKFPELPFIERLQDVEMQPLPQGVVRGLERRLGGRSPQINKFTRHYMINNPTCDRLYEYIEGAKRRNKKWSTDTNEQAGILADRQRQPADVEDKMQRSAFDDRNFALWRQAAIGAVTRAVATGVEIDAHAATATANVIRDYGFCLMEPSTLKMLDGFRFFPTQPKSGGPELTGAMIGLHIALIGQEAETEPILLVKNPSLLELMQVEQAKRATYWGDIFDVSLEAFGNRLTEHELASLAHAEQDIGYFNDQVQAAA